MKNMIIFAALLLALVGLSWDAEAGDDVVATVSSTAPTSACTAVLNAKFKYAVQCDGAARVRMSVDGQPDAGSGSRLGVKVAADALYDSPTTYDQRYICVTAVTGTVTCDVLINRTTKE